jgi:hypothetical protein
LRDVDDLHTAQTLHGDCEERNRYILAARLRRVRCLPAVGRSGLRLLPHSSGCRQRWRGLRLSWRGLGLSRRRPGRSSWRTCGGR